MNKIRSSSCHPVSVSLALAAMHVWSPTAVAEGSRAISYEVVATVYLGSCSPGASQQLLVSQGINNNGQVVGFFTECVFGTIRSFSWSLSRGLVISELPSNYDETRLFDINDEGQASGLRSFNTPGMGAEAAILEGDEWSGLGLLLNATESQGFAINNLGVVVGFSMNVATGPRRAFRTTPQGMEDLDPLLPGDRSEANGINDSGVVVGYTGVSGVNNRKGFILNGNDATIVSAFPGCTNAELRDINNAGDVIGVGNKVGSPGSLGFVMRAGRWQQIPGTIEFDNIVPVAINASGVVVGTATQLPNSNVGFVYADGETRIINDLVPDEAQIHVGRATGINDDGWIVVDATLYAVPPSGSKAMKGCVILRPVPVLPGDINADRTVDALDLSILLGAWGTSRVGADLDLNGSVDSADLGILLGNWG